MSSAVHHPTRRRRSNRPDRPTPGTSTTSTLDLPGVESILSRHARNPSAFLAVNNGTRHFSLPGIDGVIAYRPSGRRYLVQFGGVFADAADQRALLSVFRRYAHAHGRRVIAVQLMDDDACLYADAGFTVNQFGADYARRLATFSLAGKKYVQLRNKVSRAGRAGVTVVELGPQERQGAGLDDQLSAIDAAWLRSKGRHVKELAFMVGQRGGDADSSRRLFLASGPDGDPLAYVSFSPVYGPHAGWLHDLSRRRPDAPPGCLEIVVTSAVECFRAEGAPYLHFGFTPFTGLADDHEQPGRSLIAARIIRLLADKGAAIYPAADQLAYKMKWGPDLVQPEYVAFDGGIRPGAVLSLLRVTNVA